MKETVTILLDTYKEMEDKLLKLEEDNRQKIIYKYIMHPIYGQLMYFLFLFYLVYLLIT